MAAITKEQIKRIYALGAGAGLLERGSKEDDLHALVYRIAGKDSISALAGSEFHTVERELLKLMQLGNRQTPLKREGRRRPDAPAPAPGMMTLEQQGRAWRLIYRLCELEPRQATAGERMCGAVRKILGIEAGVEAPFRWVSMEDGSRLIEQLKRYVRTAERKKKEAG
jgi:hypothetical protein